MTLSLQLVGCFPNTGRTNANIDDKFDFAVIGGGSLAPDRPQDSFGEKEQVRASLDLEGQLYGAWPDMTVPFEIGIKVPLLFYLTTVDLYAQVVDEQPFHLGFGFELGFLTSFYMASTFYFTEQFYGTFTPRIHYSSMDDGDYGAEDSLSHWWLNPQLAFGFQGERWDFALYFAYIRILGDGYSFDFFDLDTDDDDNYVHKNFFEAGLKITY